MLVVGVRGAQASGLRFVVGTAAVVACRLKVVDVVSTCWWPCDGVQSCSQRLPRHTLTSARSNAGVGGGESLHSASRLIDDWAQHVLTPFPVSRQQVKVYFNLLSQFSDRIPVSVLDSRAVSLLLFNGLVPNAGTLFDRDGDGFVSFDEFFAGMLITALLFHVDPNAAGDDEIAELMVSDLKLLHYQRSVWACSGRELACIVSR